MRSSKALTLALLCWFGCASEDSSSVDQDRIYTSYSLTFDANSDKTVVRAAFKFGNPLGTSLELTAPASVTFAGQVLPFNRAVAWHEKDMAGQAGAGPFVYTNVEGRAFSNEALAWRTVDLPAEATKIARGRSFTLAWVGEPLAVGESVEVILAPANNRLNFSRWEQRATGARDIVLDATGIDKLPPGPAVLAIRRHQEKPATSTPEAGGRMASSYQPKDRTIAVE